MLAIHAPTPTGATTYFVRASGDDSRDGLRPATAFASARPAARMLQNPGDRLIVGPGTYHEGNIMPRGSGTPEAPIVLHADVTGELTGDPAGPVVIVPPNTPGATTGFIVFGRHDIVIEGFDIERAADAGIQVRPHSRTDVDSASIVVRNNRVRDGRRKGILIVATGDVAVVGNEIVGNSDAGLVLKGGVTEQRAFVSGNTIQHNALGIGLQLTNGASIADNTLRANLRGIRGIACNGLSIVRNRILELNDRAIFVSQALDVTIAENEMESGATVEAIGTAVVSKNRFTNPDAQPSRPRFASLIVSMDPAGILQLVDNQLPRTLLSGGVINLANNRGRFAIMEAADSVTATDNLLNGPSRVRHAAKLDLSRNELDTFEACVTAALIRDNEFAGKAEIYADSASATGNRAAALVITEQRSRRHCRGNPHESIGPYLVEANESGELQIGESGFPLPNTTVRDNIVVGRLRAYGRGEIEVYRNEARGILCSVSGPESRLVLTNNISTKSDAAGFIVSGNGYGRIENNLSADNADSGLATRGSRHLTIVGNTFRSNPAGGISIQVPFAGDCNDDLAVSVDELTTIIRVSLGQQSLYRCAAADLDGDKTITIDEVMQAVAAAFDRPNLTAPRVEIRSNRVEDNGRFGIDVRAAGPLIAQDNRVLRNGGVALAIKARGGQADIAVVGNVFGSSGAEGLLLNGVLYASVRNNLIFSNREAGILLRGAPSTAVINNLIYANGDDGISVGLGTEQSADDVTLANNTIYANSGWGVTMGSAGAPSKGTVVLNNIIDGNLRGGVAAERDSRSGLAIDFNLNNDGNDPIIPASSTELEGDPRFVAAAGPDGVLGGVGYADDDLHLQPGTPAIDAGSAPAAELGITGSAVAGQVSDTGIVDVGFHYGAQ